MKTVNGKYTEAIVYTADSTTTTTLQKIKADDAEESSGIGSGIEYDSQNVSSYSSIYGDPYYNVTGQDLTIAASKNAYVSGKTDPFQVYYRHLLSLNRSWRFYSPNQDR